MKLIGLDVGEKRIGVAKADPKVRIAVPVGFLLADGSEWQEIARLGRLNGTNLYVLGLPRSNEGKETRQSQYVKKFAAELVKNIPGAKVAFQDESLTSVVAEERLKKRGKKYERGDIDAEAATIILQDFLERFSEGASEPSFSDTLKAVRPSLRSSKEASEAPYERSSKETLKAPEKRLREGRIKQPEKQRSKKKIVIISIISVLVLGLAGATGVLKWRDYVRWQREEYYREQEAQMKAEVFKFTITPGETIFDVKKNLLAVKRGENASNYTTEEVEAAFSANYDFDFLAERPEGASLEGYLFPETHEFYATDTVETILQRFLEGMAEVISENNLKEKYAAHGLTLFQGITLASIVQKEAVPGEQATVAQVFYSRTNYGWRLGSDVTVSYAIDIVDPERQIYKDNAAALAIDSCYNTRLYAGLPCGPISNPGISALTAVAEPSDTAYLFFLTGDDGSMYYSYTEAEHNQNIYLHCKVLCNVSL